MLPWDRVREALAGANLYWIATKRPDGGPHLHPIWGGWVGNHLYFEGGDTTRWARNLASDKRVGFGVDSQGLHISGRGVVEISAAGEDFKALAANYASKYTYQPETDQFYRVNPEVVIALAMTSLEEFAVTPTRFRFES
jgi:nitroimidazol reductase NimA-like FMN-containing flavoprotein (pyridoxamine 5'-phosphate oxidase superfamily)